MISAANSVLRLLVGVWFLSTAVSAIATSEEGRKWLEENAKKEGVEVLPSGVQFKRLGNRGWGAWYPKRDCTISLLNHVRTIDGDEVQEPEETYKIPIYDFELPAMREVLQLMLEGDEVDVYVPAEHGYASVEDKDNVDDGDVVIAHMKLVQLDDCQEVQKTLALKCNLRTKEDCNERELLYAKNIYKAKKNHPKSFLSESRRLTRHFGELGKIEGPEQHNWNERKINILKQLAEMEERRMQEAGAHFEF